MAVARVRVDMSEFGPDAYGSYEGIEVGFFPDDPGIDSMPVLAAALGLAVVPTSVVDSALGLMT